MKPALLLPLLWLFASVRALAADLSYSIAIATTDSTTVMSELVSERFWKSFGAALPFETQEKTVESVHPDGTRDELKYRVVKAGTTATLTMGPAKLHLKLIESGTSHYEFALSTDGWDPAKMRFPDPAGARLKVTVDSESAFTLLIIQCTGLPSGVPAAGEQGMSQILTIFSGNLKTLIETGKSMFEIGRKSKPTKP